MITKDNCPKCDDLKEWLAEKNIEYKTLKIEDEHTTHQLLADEIFIDTFCDVDGCTVYTPIIYIPEDQKYYFKELFGISGLREKQVAKILELDE